MSSVYRAQDSVLERTVAVKVLAEHLSDDEKFVARFRREALAVAKLIHPNIVQVYDTGVDSDRHYIVMEYVEGRSGAQLLQTIGTLPANVSAEIGVQACGGLEYAHRHGIIHRDVKPGNLMVIGGPARRDGDSGDGEMTVKLTDFGIARAAEQTRLTQVGSVVGTAAYLAPEQARGDEATPSTDVYALGVVLYQLLTGRLPYEGSTLAELAIRRENERPLSPSSYDGSIPETLSAAVLGALESDPEARYTTARELAGALRAGAAGEAPTPATAALTGDETDLTRRLPRTEAGPVEEATPVSEREAAPRRRAPSAAPRPVITPAAKRRSKGAGVWIRRLALLIALALIAAVIAGLIILSQQGGTETSDSVRTTIDDQITRLEEIVRDNTQ
jgi:serine/threonine-protein kinase